MKSERPAPPIVAPSPAAVLVAASLAASLGLWAFDVVTWPSVRQPWPLLASALLASANGAALGLAIAAVVAGGVRRIQRPRLRAGVSGALALSISVLAARESAVGLRGVSFATPLLVAFTVCSASVLFGGLDASIRTEARRRRLVTAALVALSALLLAWDRAFLSSSVERAYSFTEAVAHLASTLALALALRSVRKRTVIHSVAAAACLWLVAFAACRPLRVALERALPALWEEPVYVARWVRRARRIESARGHKSELAAVAEKYELRSSVLVDENIWNAPPALPMREETNAKPWSVVVFFVDTLRADVAHDPAVMPRTAALMDESFTFQRAYASGSSTLLTLAPMLGCRYDATPREDRAKLLDAAGQAGLQTALVIPKSAVDYHREHYPSFRFDYEDVVVDRDGAHIPTASTIVDRSLSWLSSARPERFFLWLYHYDVHAWASLEETYLEQEARSAGLPRDGDASWRYRAAAAGVDRSLERLRAGLEELGLGDHTLVVFASDHGEGLGQNDFWAHSTHLWESLIRVPLAINVPGRAGWSSDVAVSTIDLAPTLAPFLGASLGDGCHGVDLLSSDLERRPHPILFSAMIDGRITRLGLLGSRDRKLVVDLRDVEARLLRIEDGIEEDVSDQEREELALRLGQLVRAPIYGKR